MRDYIKKQLESITVANLIKQDTEASNYFIPKYVKPHYEVGKCYLIKVSKFLVNNTTSLLAINCNNGQAPKQQYYKIIVSRVSGKLIYVDGLEFNFDTKTDGTETWSGWLDTEELILIAVAKECV